MLALLELLQPLKRSERLYWLFIKKLGLQMNQAQFLKKIREHPNYPSLLSFSDTLNEYRLKSAAFVVPADEIETLPAPFLVHLNEYESQLQTYGIVEYINDHSVKLYSGKTGQRTLRLDDFRKIYNGVAFTIDTRTDTDKKEFTGGKRANIREKLFRYAAAVALPVISIFYCIGIFRAMALPEALLHAAYCTLSLTGIVIGILLLIYDVDKYNPTVRQICQRTRKINCAAILDSKGAALWGISWSQIGFIYFLGIWLVQVTQGTLFSGTAALLPVLSISAALYSFFSVYYQWKIAKQWCTLCLSVQAVLVLQAFVSLLLIQSSAFSFSLNTLLPVVALFAVLIIGIIALVPVLKKAKEGAYKARELRALKYDPFVFTSILQRQPTFTGDIDDLGIRLGPVDAKYTILKICNPFCGPCARAHAILDELIENNPEVGVRIIFAVTSNEEDSRNKPVRHFLNAMETQSPHYLKQMLDSWYTSHKKDYNAFADQYPLTEEKNYKMEIEKMNEWCQENKINATPTIYVNGHRLPDQYNFFDLKYFFSNSTLSNSNK